PGGRHDDLLADRRGEEPGAQNRARRTHTFTTTTPRLDPPWLQSNYERLRGASGALPAWSVRQRARHLRRADPGVELLRGDEAQRERGLAQREPIVVRLERDLGRLVVPDVRGERRHQHETRVEMLGDARFVRLDASRAVLLEGQARIGEQLSR